jgi:endonuclease YncB( thermonuclease family)
MANGLLRVFGTIDLSQFWPTGSSDADTAKILVDVGQRGFEFRPDSRAPFRSTRAFRNAIVIGRVRRTAIDSNNRITVRFQGIDAPELHYRPQSHLRDSQGRTRRQKERYLEVNEEYRQHGAETATVKLLNFLAKAGQDPLPCRVETAVDSPDEVFDTYGRFVGDIIVRIGQREYNVNRWLVRMGHAYPAFYNSMSVDEINALRAAADEAWANDRHIWRNLSDYADDFDWELQYRRPSRIPVYVETADMGEIVLPKLFRRLAKWEVNRYAGMITTTFWSYLDQRNDACYLTEEFLEAPTTAPIHGLHEFLHMDNYFECWPEDLVFREASSRLIQPGGGTVNW